MTTSLARRGAPARAPRSLRRAAAGTLLLLAALLFALGTPPRAGADTGESKARALQAGAISAGSYSSCALRGSGVVVCWGAGNFGQLGHGRDGDSAYANAPGNAVVGLDDAVSLNVGRVHACAVRSNGHVACWGWNGGATGALGHGPDLGDHSATPVELTGVTDATAVALTDAGGCVLHATGAVSCWGDNNNGQLGQPLTTTAAPTPVDVPGVSDVVGIDSGWFHVCAVRKNGSLWCWGRNSDGQAGQPSTQSETAAWKQPTPQAVPGVSDAVAVSGGLFQTCFLRATGAVSCMGSDAVGEAGLGTPTATSSEVPQAVVGLPGPAVSISVGMQIACAVIDTGAVLCWGTDDQGQLGNGLPYASTATPAIVTGVDATAVSVRRHTVCAIKRQGGAACWGDDDYGSVGNGDELWGSTPEPSRVIGFATPYSRIATPLLTMSAPAAAADHETVAIRLTIRNDGPDPLTPSITVSGDPALGFGTLPANVAADGDHTAIWRPATLPPGTTASVDIPVIATGPGDTTIRASITGADALNPRRPLDRGPLPSGQEAATTITVAAPTPTPTPSPTPAAATPQGGNMATPGSPAGTTRTPLAALDPAKLIALAKPKACRKAGAPLRVVLAVPAGAAVRSATAAVKGKASAPLTGKLSGPVRLPRKVERAIDASARGSVKIAITVTLVDGRTATRTLTVRRCS